MSCLVGSGCSQDASPSETSVAQACKSTPARSVEPTDAILSYSMERDGGFAQFVAASPEQSVLVTSDGGGGTTVWSPDGTHLAYSTQSVGFRVQEASPGAVPIEIEGSFPEWSPDSSRLAFYFDGDVYVVNADGTGRTNLTNLPFFIDGLSAIAWSPDGQTILFDSNRDDTGNMFAMDPDGRNQRKVSQSDFPDSNPAWSSDGTQILADWSTPDGGGLAVMNADGSDQHMVVADPTVLGFSWSPDGCRIVFATARDDNVEIYIADADGMNQTNLTNTEADEGFHPVFSPDGSRIAFDSSREGSSDIFVMDADGTNIVRWTSSDAREFAPIWTPSGAHRTTDLLAELFIVLPRCRPAPRT